MKDEGKTKEQLAKELRQARKRIDGLEGRLRLTRADRQAGGRG